VKRPEGGKEGFGLSGESQRAEPKFSWTLPAPAPALAALSLLDREPPPPD
jgi:hypothetical protein